jgi:protoheme IX farnesyltransferase
MFVYCLFLIPVSLLPFLFGVSGILSVWVATIAGLWFMYYAVKLFFDLQDKSATQLMFASFFYLPIVQIIYLIDKV